MDNYSIFIPTDCSEPGKNNGFNSTADFQMAISAFKSATPTHIMSSYLITYNDGMIDVDYIIRKVRWGFTIELSPLLAESSAIASILLGSTGLEMPPIFATWSKWAFLNDHGHVYAKSNDRLVRYLCDIDENITNIAKSILEFMLADVMYTKFFSRH